MTDQPSSANDQSTLDPIYRSAGIVLAWGFRVAASLLAGGLLLAAIQGDALSNKAEPIPKILEHLFDGKSSALVDLAIVAMVLTPIAAVISIALGFYRIADRRYMAASLFVLAVLGISIVVSMVT